MLASYTDETGDYQDPHKHFVGMAGLLAQSDAWKELHADWETISADSEDGFKLPFHMVDFVQQKQNFKSGWESQEKRMRVLSHLLSAVEQTKAIPIGAIVSIEDFKGLTDLQKTKLGGDQADPYYTAFQECTYNLAFAAAISSPWDSVSMIYARRVKFTGRTELWWYAIKQHNPHLSHWMSSYTAGEPSDLTPLQAADIWAYSLSHHFEHVPAKKREAECAFQRFLRMAIDNAAGHRFFTYFDRREMLLSLGDDLEDRL
jgi:hypothetical protein